MLGMIFVALQHCVHTAHSFDPLLQRSYSSFSLLQSFSPFCRVPIVSWNQMIGVSSWFSHLSPNVCVDEAHSSCAVFSLSPGTAGSDAQSASSGLQLRLWVPSTHFVKETGLSFLLAASSWGPWRKEASFYLGFYCKHLRRCQRAPEGRPRCTWGEKVQIFNGGRGCTNTEKYQQTHACLENLPGPV